MSRNLYQNIRTQVKKNLRRVIEHYDIEYAMRAESAKPLKETEQDLRQVMNRSNFHVVHETDVKAIHNYYDIEYPEFKILKYVEAEQVMGCRHCQTGLSNDPSISTILPPGIILYELPNGRTRVSAVRPSTLLAIFRNGAIKETVVEVESLVWDVLEDLPQSRMLSTEPPLRLGQNSTRRKIKNLLNPVVSLVDAEYTIHVTTQTPPAQVKKELREHLEKRGQKVLGEVAGGRIMLAVNPGQAHKALAIEADVGVFAPLSISVAQEDGLTHVRSVRPTTLLIFFEQEGMQDILMEMEMLLWNSIVGGVPNANVVSRQPPLPPQTGQALTAQGLPGGMNDLEDQYARSD